MGWMLVATNQELGRLLRHSAASEPEPAFHVFPSFVHISKIDPIESGLGTPYYFVHKAPWLSHCAMWRGHSALWQKHSATAPYAKVNTVPTARVIVTLERAATRSYNYLSRYLV
jgi:hypothetical protein